MLKLQKLQQCNIYTYYYCIVEVKSKKRALVNYWLTKTKTTVQVTCVKTKLTIISIDGCTVAITKTMLLGSCWTSL